MVGTPGRLSDIIKRTSSMDLKRLEVLVLDEADRLLEMGFKAELDAIMARLPKQRRTGQLSGLRCIIGCITSLTIKMYRLSTRHKCVVGCICCSAKRLQMPNSLLHSSSSSIGSG